MKEKTNAPSFCEQLPNSTESAISDAECLGRFFNLLLEVDKRSNPELYMPTLKDSPSLRDRGE